MEELATLKQAFDSDMERLKKEVDKLIEGNKEIVEYLQNGTDTGRNK